MPHIQVLDDATINKIAAGEVIERPASIVKELVENSIDAGASAITVEIQNGGISLIRVSDNGCGIDADEVPSAFLRHATSKIRSAQELSLIMSLGFRGEALASIAAVSRTEVLTKTVEELTGIRYCIEGGREMFSDEVAAVPGTTFKVENLFFNTPARLKFLKKPNTEASAVTHFMQNIAMGHPEISFSYLRGNTRVLQTPGDYQLKNAVFAVYGKEMLSELIPVHLEGPVTVDGFISRPQAVRANRTYQHFYLNGRMIQSSMIERVLMECYKDLIMPGNFPIAILHLKMEPSLVDVNVHPTKLQVRFSNDQLIKDALYEAVLTALEQEELSTHVTEAALDEKGSSLRTTVEIAPETGVPENQLLRNAMLSENERSAEDTSSEPQNDSRSFFERRSGYQDVPRPQQVSIPDFQNLLQESASHYGKQPESTEILPKNSVESVEKTAAAAEDTSSENSENVERVDNPSVSSQAEFQQTEDAGRSFGELRSQRKSLLPPGNEIHWVGQAFRTYWMFEYGQLLYVIDQHAAHERVLYDKIKAQMTSGSLDSQILLEPQVITLSPADEQTLEEQKDLFEVMGFEIEPFGDGTVLVRGVPYIFNGPMSVEDFTGMVSMLTDGASEVRRDILLEKMAMTSCKAAVKGNTAMSLMEIKALYESLEKTENPYNCPHGRPTIVIMTQTQMEKLFKRIV